MKIDPTFMKTNPMKKLLPAALAAIFTVVFAVHVHAQAGQPFVLSNQGAVAEIETKGPGGMVLSYTRSTVAAIETRDANNFTITVNAEVLSPDRKPLAASQTVTTEVRNGVVEVAPDMGDVKIEGKIPSYPADMKVGYTNDYSFTVKTMGMEVVTTGKDKVVAEESVSTPAGAFDCFKVETEMAIAVMGQNQQIKTTTWMARGVGVVKSEVRDNAGSLSASQTLVSLKR